MSKPKKIPIERAKFLGKQYDYDGVLIFGINTKTNTVCITTYGANKEKCFKMRNFGDEVLVGALSFFEELDAPRLQRTKS